MPKKEEKFSIKKDFPVRSLNAEINQLIEGLTYISESDYKIELFAGSDATQVSKEEILKQVGRGGSNSIEEITFGDFFEKLTTVRNWYGEQEKTSAERFARLRIYLERFLSDLKVFRIGKIQIDIYVVGLDNDGRLVGIKTRAIET